MKAGRELDALIEVEIFERCAHYLVFDVREGDEGHLDYITWTCKHCEEQFRGLAFGKGYKHSKLKHYSTQIADAWLVVEKLRSKGLMWRGGYFAESGGCNVAFGFSKPKDKEVRYKATAPKGEEPFAICLAALEAVEVE